MIKVGKASQMLGISSQTIRRYESLGMLDTVEKKDNNYRYFNCGSFNVIMRIIFFKKLGFNTKQIRKLQMTDDIDVINGQFEGRKEAILRNIEKEKQIIKKIEELEEEINGFHDGKIYECQFNETYTMIYYDDGFQTHDFDYPLFHKWIELLPLTNSSPFFKMNPDGSFHKKFGYGLMLEKRFLPDQRYIKSDYVYHYRRQNAICLHIESVKHKKFDIDSCAKMFEYAEKKGVSIHHIIGKTIITFDRSNKRRIFHCMYGLYETE